MRKVNNILVILALGAALSGCTKHERVPGPEAFGRKPISFSTTTEESKADVTLADLKQPSDGWGVYAYYTGTAAYTKPSEAEGVIFNDRRVYWNTSDGGWWDYALDADHRKEYWPMDPEENVTFFAYAPYSLYHGSAGVDSDAGPYITYTATTDLSAQKDLLWGTNTSGLPHRNVSMADYADSVVDMHFRHAPAKIHFTINGATLGDESAVTAYGAANTTTTNGNLTRSSDETGGTVYANNQYRTLYWAYRQKTVTTTQVYRRTISGFKILLNQIQMTNFIKNGILYLNNPDAYMPYWVMDGDQYLDYTFGISDMATSIINPGNETTLANGWGTAYLGVDNEPTELLPTPNNYIYMVPKEAETPGPESRNINITATYHVIGLSKTEQFTRTTTTVSWQRVAYYTRNSNYYYQQSDGNYGTGTTNLNWADFTSTAHPSNQTITDGATTNVGTPVFNYSQDDDGRGFRAVGSINSDILGGRDYIINLYLDGRELNLTVIPQQWDLEETLYDYDQTLNPILQALTYDSDFVYQVVNDKVYINNRMGKFYFRLGSGKYLYWQASLVGDDAFAFTDENGEYLLDGNGDYLTSIRGNIGEEMNYIYVKATNTSSPVTSSAKLRIYLFDSDNHAIVALPIVPDWLFLNATYNVAGGTTERVQEWTVVQAAN